MMVARILLLSCFFVAQIGYAKSSQCEPLPEKKICSVEPFNVVNVDGNINLNLHTGYAKPVVIITGDPRDLANIKLDVRRGILRITSRSHKPPCYGAITAEIRGRYLNGLIYHGNGVITGEHLRANLERVVLDNRGTTTLKGSIRLGYLEVLGSGYTQIGDVGSSHLQVKLSKQAKVKITGVAELHRLDMEDDAWFSLAWVKTPTLIVRSSGKAFMQLAGIVNKLDAELCDASRLNARYLRARRAFVKTHGSSVAKITAIHHQHTLATDTSDIQFYNLPEMRTDFMAFSGAVLDMRAFNTAFVEEPTPYNK